MGRLSNDAPLPASRVLDASAIPGGLLGELFDLYANHYDHAEFARFQSDLRAKDFVLILDCQGRTVGFTTARVFDFDWHGESIAVLFSGDTIVDRRFWGEQELARAWLRQTGMLARRRPGRRLVWFLISKGHRTYRYLPVFAREYVPCETNASLPSIGELRNAIASAMFGSRFDAETGIVRSDTPRDRLRAEYAEPTAREGRLPGVDYFLSANPGFREGDELACLCELSRDNMRPRARRWFDEGWHAG